MKLLTFSIDGKVSWGAVKGDGIVDLGRRFGDRVPTLRAALAGDHLREAAGMVDAADADHALGDIVYLPVIPDPEKILCVGLNYEPHRLEGGHPKTEHPTIFARFANSQTGHEQPLLNPRESEKLDYEGEIAVVIGKRGRRIAEAAALDHIAGYACYNEGSVRDWQRHSGQYIPGKNFEKTGAFGPWMVTPDEIPDVDDMTLVTRLNGQEMQRANSSELTFSIPAVIAYCSTFTTLEAGDVIVTGTPGGVGSRREPPVFMKPGDMVEVEVSSIGVLRNKVEQD
ncbi:MAG: fumarylacetoacetate hydrolase family protein [Alphaproteobacteria bacterium]